MEHFSIRPYIMFRTTDIHVLTVTLLRTTFHNADPIYMLCRLSDLYSIIKDTTLSIFFFIFHNNIQYIFGLLFNFQLGPVVPQGSVMSAYITDTTMSDYDTVKHLVPTPLMEDGTIGTPTCVTGHPHCNRAPTLY